MSELSQILESAKEANTAANKERLSSPELIQKTRALRASAGTGIHHAFCKTDAPASSDITCYLDTDGTGEEITVHCDICGTTNLNSAWPYLTDGQRISVYKEDGEWYCPALFQQINVCEE